MEIKVGDILCVKTTGELVYVLGPFGETGPLKEQSVTVRRATMTEGKSIKHEINEFRVDELETPEQHLNREADKARLQMRLSHKLNKEEALLEQKELQEVLEQQSKVGEGPISIAGKKKPDFNVN